MRWGMGTILYDLPVPPPPEKTTTLTSSGIWGTFGVQQKIGNDFFLTFFSDNDSEIKARNVLPLSPPKKI